ncbi:MAG: hypothetical protein ABEI98_00085 [Halorhabdus sp.]
MLLTVTALVGGLVLGAGGVGAAWYKQRETDRADAEIDAVLSEYSLDVEDGDCIELQPVDVRQSITGLVSTWRQRAKERRLAENGYVKWYRLDSQLHRPKWVKPTQDNGRGVGKVTTSEGPYYFDRDAMVTDTRTGACVAMHEVGDADPINLRDTAFPGIPVDRLEELLNMEAEAEKPGFFENLNISGTTAFILITVVLFLGYAATRVM